MTLVSYAHSERQVPIPLHHFAALSDLARRLDQKEHETKRDQRQRGYRNKHDAIRFIHHPAEQRRSHSHAQKTQAVVKRRDHAALAFFDGSRDERIQAGEKHARSDAADGQQADKHIDVFQKEQGGRERNGHGNKSDIHQHAHEEALFLDQTSGRIGGDDHPQQGNGQNEAFDDAIDVVRLVLKDVGQIKKHAEQDKQPKRSRKKRGDEPAAFLLEDAFDFPEICL